MSLSLSLSLNSREDSLDDKEKRCQRQELRVLDSVSTGGTDPIFYGV